ncbi:MAG TPA: flagellar protein FlaG [Bryobacteraceae bacterium]|nr:flagellar protein FlaG [Bryobacteraceae bacterium]
MDVSDVSSVGFVGNLAVPSGGLTAQQASERRQLLQAVKTVNESGQLGRNQLVFMVDSQTHRPIIRVEDRETHEVVLQIPPEYVLRLAQDMPTDSVQTTPPHADT